MRISEADYVSRKELVASLSGILGFCLFSQASEFDRDFAGTALMWHGAVLAICSFGLVISDYFQKKRLACSEALFSYLPILTAFISGGAFFSENNLESHIMWGIVITYFPLCFYGPILRIPELGCTELKC